ncbi:MAG: DNA polymerase III subunit gamma/tau [Candidatus Omnitrophota bacterium]
MSYQVLARKYRPQIFSDVIGQDVIIRTLINSIAKDRVANAYIFCGPRGVGKTTVARLISKALNCTDGKKSDPCDKCSSCREIALGNNIDVLEIDGASNNGVDEIRTLRENVKFSPSEGKYKIYIIDEVHMLSQGAFNALLKTLEEPPGHVKFIFATTESHKVLPTIMSRCQRFDFKRIPPLVIVDKINEIAKKEKIEIEEKAALTIARSADGSLRDALVVLDQMIAFSGKKINAGDVTELLGMVKKDQIFKLADAVINRDPSGAARTLDEIISNGKDPIFIVNNLIEHFRDIMMLKTAGPTLDMTFTKEEVKDIKERSLGLSLDEVLYILQNLTYCITLMKGTMFTRAPLEIALIRLTKRGDILSLPDMVKEIQRACSGAEMRDVPFSGKNTVSVENCSTNEEELQEETGQIKTREENEQKNEADFTPINAYWKTILRYVKEKKMSVFTFLNVAKPVELSKKKMVIGFSKDHVFNKEALEAGSNKILVEEAVRKVTDWDTHVEFSILEFLGEKTDKEEEEAAEKKSNERKAIKPVIEKAMDIFGGHIIRDLTEEK